MARKSGPSRGNEPNREIASIHWRDKEMQVAVPPGHPFATRTEVRLAALIVHRRKKRLNRAAQAFVELQVEQPAGKEEAKMEVVEV